MYSAWYSECFYSVFIMWQFRSLFTFIAWNKAARTFFYISPFVFHGRIKVKWFGSSWGWVNTLTFMHLADALIQSDLQCIQVIHFLSVCMYNDDKILIFGWKQICKKTTQNNNIQPSCKALGVDPQKRISPEVKTVKNDIRVPNDQQLLLHM